MKNRGANILIVALLLLAVFGVVLVVFLHNARAEFPENIKVEKDGVTEEVLTVKDLRLNPSESKEYSVSLVCEVSGTYHISLDHEETKNGGMKNFVDVTIKCNGAVVYEGDLGTLLDSDVQVQFSGELYETKPVAVSICYEMPREVGNEAQDTYAEFKIGVTIKKA